MTTDTTDTVTWAITFGLGHNERRGTYTEILVPADWSEADQADAVYAAAFEAYGRNWAFAYPPEKIEDSVRAYGLIPDERIVRESRPLRASMGEITRMPDKEVPGVRYYEAEAEVQD